MTDLNVPNVFTSGTSIVASEMNANFDAVETMVNTTGVPKLQDGVVETDKIVNSAVTSAKVADGAIATGKIADGAVTTGKIADSAVTRAKVAAAERIPTGVIMDFAGASAPTGWLLCDGSAVSRTTYADLWDLFRGGTSSSPFGNGDGSTTFNLPDLRGRVAVGLDNLDNSVGTGGGAADRLTAADKDTLGASGGLEKHELTAAELPDHKHKVNPPATNTLGPSADASFLRGTSNSVTVASESHTHNVDIAEFDSGAVPSAASPEVKGDAHNNMQPYLLVGKIIKF